MFSLHLVLLLGYLHLLLTPYLRRGPRFPGFPVLAQFLLVLVGFSSTFFLLYTLPYSFQHLTEQWLEGSLGAGGRSFRGLRIAYEGFRFGSLWPS